MTRMRGDPLVPTAVTLAPLGVPLRLEVGQGVGASAVAEACRGWDTPAISLLPPQRLCVEPSRALTGTGGAVIRVDGPDVTIRGPGVVAHADLAEGAATCTVSSEYLLDPDALRQEVLKPLVLMLITRHDRTPLHASAFIVDGTAVLMAGRSGAGKSCLARAADALGFQVLSDDAVFIQLEPRLKVWGWPSAAHLLPHDAAGAAGPLRDRNGKVKRVVPLRSASDTAIACEQAVLCVLSRGVEASLAPISEPEVNRRLWPLDEGFDLLPAPTARVIAALSVRGAWDLRLSDDPHDAIRLLASSLAKLRETACGRAGEASP